MSSSIFLIFGWFSLLFSNFHSRDPVRYPPEIAGKDTRSKIPVDTRKNSEIHFPKNRIRHSSLVDGGSTSEKNFTNFWLQHPQLDSLLKEASNLKHHHQQQQHQVSHQVLPHPAHPYQKQDPTSGGNKFLILKSLAESNQTYSPTDSESDSQPEVIQKKYADSGNLSRDAEGYKNTSDTIEDVLEKKKEKKEKEEKKKVEELKRMEERSELKKKIPNPYSTLDLIASKVGNVSKSTDWMNVNNQDFKQFLESHRYKGQIASPSVGSTRGGENSSSSSSFVSEMETERPERPERPERAISGLERGQVGDQKSFSRLVNPLGFAASGAPGTGSGTPVVPRSSVSPGNSHVVPVPVAPGGASVSPGPSSGVSGAAKDLTDSSKSAKDAKDGEKYEVVPSVKIEKKPWEVNGYAGSGSERKTPSGQAIPNSNGTTAGGVNFSSMAASAAKKNNGTHQTSSLVMANDALRNTTVVVTSDKGGDGKKGESNLNVFLDYY